MRKRIASFLLMVIFAGLVVACGGSATNTPAPQATTAAGSSATTAPAQATTAPAARPTTGATAVPTLPPVAARPDATGVVAMPPQPTAPANAKKGGTLTVGLSGSLHPTLHPNQTTGDTTAARERIALLIWSPGLLDYNFTTLQWQLEMAKEVKVSEDGKTFTFTLKPDLKWSDGSPLTVDDFLFAHEGASKENKEKPTEQFARIQDKKLVTSYKVDATAGTITATTDKAYARDLAYYFISVFPMPKKVWDGKSFYDPNGNPEIRKPTVVSGPYMIDEYDDKAQAKLKRNPNWYRGQANFDEIVVRPYQPNVLVEALKTNQVDVTFDSLPPSQYADIKANANVNVYEWSGVQNDRRSIAFNVTAPPFNDVNLRQAILHTLDQRNMITLAESGRAFPEFSIIYASSPYFNPEVPRYPFDLAKARQKLTEGGYKIENNQVIGKDGQPLKFEITHNSTDNTAKQLAQYMQAQVKLVGIDVEVVSRDPQAQLSALLTRKYNASVNFTGAGLFPDPDTLKTFYIKGGAFNVMGYDNSRINEIFATASTELDGAKRKVLYDEAQKILTTEVPTFLMYSRGFYVAANKKLGGIDVSKFKGGNIMYNFAATTWYFTS
jgi:peptide/nickel transport system substrate-binding protein